jgi:hypothetical protein
LAGLAGIFLLVGTSAHAQTPRPATPSAAQVRSAAAFGAERRGAVSWAVIDSRGRLRGRDAARLYPSASVSKALLLVAALRQVGSQRAVPADLAAALDPMIRRSDNGAAQVVYARVGRDAAFGAIARAARLRRLQPAGRWSDLGVSAADVARFFRVADRLVPRRHRAYARRLLGTVVPTQRWGIPRVAEPAGWHVLLKGGWRRGIIHQGAVAERDGQRVAVAVLTDGNPSHDYGTFTVAGIARRLLTPVGDLARTARRMRAPTRAWNPSPRPRPSRATTRR